MTFDRHKSFAAVFLGAVLAMLLTLTGGASACACGEYRGVVVAHGSSPNGVPWRIKATRLRGSGQEERLLLNFSHGKPGDEGGYFLGMPLPAPPRLVLSADSGGGDEEEPDKDISGVAAAKAVELQVEMNDGEVLTVEPALPPLSLRKRFPWLHGLRYFDVFFSASEDPTRVTAFDENGRVLGRSKSHHGLFII